MISRTSWLFAAVLLAGASVHAQEKAVESVKFTPPVIKKDSSPSAKPGKTATSNKGERVRFTPPVIKKDQPGKVKLSDLKPATRAKIERDGHYRNLTPAELDEVRSAVKPALKKGQPLPAPPLPPPPPELRRPEN